MKLGNSVIIARYLSRPNRFTVLAKHQRRLLGGDFPNPGRLKELLKPNSEIAINHCHSQVRRTQFDFVAISTGRNWISIDSRIPNKLAHEALKEGRLPGFRSYSTVIPEKMFGNSRFDFLSSSRDRKYLLEVKLCTLAVSKLGIFPDSPTLRGRRHLSDLIHARRNGYRACIMFVIQRSDVKGFMPNWETDSQFAEALKRAKSNGVEVLARKCIVRNFRIDLDRPVPVFM